MKPRCDRVIKGRLLSFSERPTDVTASDCYSYWPKGALAIENGKIAWIGNASDLPERFAEWPIDDHASHLILPGFIDAHTHYPQMEVIASYGSQLMDWLETYTFRQEARFAEKVHCEVQAGLFFDELINHGVTTAAVYTTSHPDATTAFFEEASARNMRMIGGKVLMDRSAPEELTDTPQRAYDESKRLIETWHETGRLSYAITPRFAITSSNEQMAAIQSLVAEYPDCYVQTHLSENLFEISETLRFFSEAKDYTHVYEQYGLLGPKSLFGHCIHLSDRERSALAETGSVAVFCPSSNAFLGSGLFDYEGFQASNIRLAMGSDMGAGTSCSMLATAADAYKICQLRNCSLNPLESFYGLTLGNARALSMEAEIGTLAVGSEADLVVLNTRATHAMRTRMLAVESLPEELFVLQTLGDDRAIEETYIAGDAQKSALIAAERI
ncbi:MAG: guanine deaminase [Pseudomonadota bacterium]